MQRFNLKRQTVSASEILHLVVAKYARAGAVLRRLRPGDMARVIVVSEVALTVVLAVISAKLVWASFEPPAWAAAQISPSAVPPRRSGTPAVLTEIDPFHRASTIGPVTRGAVRAPETMLNLQLFGIRAGHGDAGGSAIVATPDNIQAVFHVGQEIMAGVRLEQIFPDRIVIRRNGVAETLSFDRDGSTTQAAAAPAAQESAAGQSAPATDSVRRLDVPARDLMTLLRFTPREQNGVRGLLLEGSADAALMQQAGLEPGDFLLTVNGASVGDVGALTSLATAGETRFSLAFERKGQRKVHRLEIDREQ